MRRVIRKFLTDRSGATMLEYGLVIAIVALGAVGLLTQIGEQPKGAVEKANTAIKGARP